MRKINFRQAFGIWRKSFALGLVALIASTQVANGQTILINPAQEGGFELGSTFAANGWTVANGTAVNQWYVGTVPTGMTNNSAYISGDVGVTNGYVNNSASVVHFYRDVTFPAGETAIALSFNWKALGETGFFDALMVSVAPTSFTPSASTTSLGSSFLAAPAVELGRFWLQTTTQSATIQIPPSLVGNCTSSSTMRLIFTWKNDGGLGSNPSAAIDNIQLVSNLNSITSAGGTFTIDNSLPLTATNFPNFTSAIAALNGASSCGLLNPVTFNVAAGQTFNELPPVITATGSTAAPITFQKSGIGANPTIVSAGTSGTNDGSIVISGGDFITFDGIDINNSASNTMEYGYLIRNASAIDGAKNNVIRNASIQMNRTVTTSASSAILVSTTSTGGGVTATNASGSNDNTQIRNISINGAINGISILGTSAFPDQNNVVSVTAGNRNVISNIGPVGPTSVAARGIYFTNQTGSAIQNSDVSNVTSNQSTSQGVFVTGCVGNTVINGNSVYAISNQGSTSTSSIAYGIQAQNATSGTNTIRISNNMVGNIFTSFTGTATASRYAIGIHAGVASATASQSYEVYHNTVSIGNGLAPTYSNSCFEIQNVSAVYKVHNNLFTNFTGAQGATARHYTWVTTSATNIGATGSISNNNDLYIANDVNVSGFVARANTTNIPTVLAWTAAITAVPGTDQNSFSAAPTFVNNDSDLHLNMGATPSQIESSGNAGLGVATDFDGQNRPGPTGSVNGGATAPDCGADEFDGSPLSPPIVTLNSVTPPTSPQCSAAPRLVSVNVANTSGTVASVSIAYSFNGVAQGSFPMTNTAGTIWEATIPAASPVNATVSWSVTATNSFGISGSYLGASYADEPLFGTTGNATASTSVVCSASPSNLTASLERFSPVASGTSSGTSSSSGISPFYHGYGGVKTQYIYRASELTAMGLTAGNITALSLNITTLGTPTLNSFTIDMGHTAQNAAVANTAILTGLTQVYSNAAQALAVGANTYTFSTPFAWDGVSNVVISFNYSNVNTGGSSSTVTTTGAGSFTSSLAIYADNASASCLYTAPSSGQACMGTSSNTTSSTRPLMTITGNTASPVTSVNWFDGATLVGTGNPLTVNPTVTTTYTANITAAGCVLMPSPTTTVTVNPLPSAPTASNSTQCGTAVPTASVTSTSGLPTPTFIWYSAPTAGTALQTSTSTTYNTAVTSTTTFYVAELNTVTGCESARTAVTVTVTSADNITASVDNATICIGSSVNLSVVNTNPTPVQTYTYTWTNAQTGSGLVSATGANQTITPTQPGTYTYDVAGVDGGCNAVSSISVTVNPFTATLTPINVSCNGYNDGSFSVASTTCGSAPFSYIVDGGALTTSIPTNLTPGAHTVIVQNAAGFQSSLINISITEPSTTISAPVGTNASVCQDAASATVSASSTTNTTSAMNQTVTFNVTAQPVESFTAPGNIVATATLPTLPAGAVVTSLVLNYNGITPNASGEWQSDVRLGLTGSYTNANASGTGTTGSGTVIGTPFNYTRTITSPVGFPLNGGTINLMYHNNFNDGGATTDALFATGNVASLIINYTVPVPATISWWNAASGGTQIGTGSPFETVGTSVLPNTNTPGVYTVYAQGDFSGCANFTRTPVTVTVRPKSTSTTTITACATYTWTNGTTYTSSGTYTQTLVNSVGCDSIATLNLTINQPSTATQAATACASYTWPVNGTTYTSSGSYTHTLAGANAVGCDSTITLNLTINQPTTATQTVSACVTYTWPVNGTTYTTSGAYTHTLVGANAVGCDSTITLNLTINQPSTATQAATACASYTWIDGNTYTASNNTATFTIVGGAANGCDSVVTLNLTINQPTTGVDVQTACGSYTWIDGIVYTTSNSTATFTIVGGAANGCDSVVTLNLTINQPTTGVDVQTACGSYTWIDGNVYTTSNSTATFTIVGGAANGCDSVVTLNLTINPNPTATATDNGDGTITASAGTTYQWIDCGTGLAIAGETGQTLTVAANGSYAVVVSNGTCDDTSACVLIDYIGIKELAETAVQLMPNPTRDFVTITMTVADATLEVRDAQGKLMVVKAITSGEQVDLSQAEVGVYFFTIKTTDGSVVKRVVKN